MLTDQGKPYYNSTPGQGLLPQQEMLKTDNKEKLISFGIPKEITHYESRILLTPEDVGILINRGHKVIFETGAGNGARFSDQQYVDQGASLVYSAAEAYMADIILKIMAPTLKEIEMMKPRQVLFSTLNLVDDNKAYFQALMKKKITACYIEGIRDDDGSYPIMRAMGEIAGNACIYLASRYLSDPRMGQARMLGGFSGVEPTEVVILGAGTVAEYAARTALGMGAHVRIFDPSIQKIRRLQSLINPRVYSGLLNQNNISKALPNADVVICALFSHQRVTPCLISEDMVRSMKQGAVLLDVSIDRGPCAETSHLTTLKSPVYESYGVIHYCVPNLLSRFSNTASIALSNYFMSFFCDMADNGGITNTIIKNLGLRNAAYIYHGVLTKEFISHKTGLSYKDINLLISSMH